MLQLALAITLAASGAKLLDFPHANETAITVLALGLVALVVFARQARATPAVTG